MSLEWSIDNSSFTGCSVEELSAIEDGADKYYRDLLSVQGLSAFQSPNQFVDVDIAIHRQVLTSANVIIDTTVDVYHVGNSGITNLADLLRFVTNTNTTGSDHFIVLDALIGMNITLDLVSFSNYKESRALVGGFNPYYLQQTLGSKQNAQNEKTLIVVVSILSFALFVLSIILIWVAGGWLALRWQVKVLIRREEELTRMTMGIEAKPTHDTEEDTSPQKDEATENTNPSGILGAQTFDGLGVKMTPSRPRASDLDSEIATPMSVYSDSGRMPIGITSMRKLIANRDSQENIAINPYAMRRLDYDE